MRPVGLVGSCLSLKKIGPKNTCAMRRTDTCKRCEAIAHARDDSAHAGNFRRASRMCESKSSDAGKQ
eukprot:5100495-Pleurochrysis_carterae.AAC.1